MIALRAIRGIGKAHCRLLHEDLLAGLPEHYRPDRPKDMVKFKTERRRLLKEIDKMLKKIDKCQKLRANSKGYKEKTDQLVKETDILEADIKKFEDDYLDVAFKYREE